MIKNLLKSKKGVAIESSILFLLVTFLMCTLISVYSASVRKKANGFKEELTESIRSPIRKKTARAKRETGKTVKPTERLKPLRR